MKQRTGSPLRRPATTSCGYVPTRSRRSSRTGSTTARRTPVDVEKGLESTNIAADGKPDLRFLAWAKAGTVSLKKGANSIRFRMDSANNNHGYLDCFVFVNEPFTPRGTLKPDQLAAAARLVAEANKGWFVFDPKPDPFSAASGINLRGLNEKTAGDGGWIGVKGSQFVHTKTGEPVRFWAVNGPSSKARDDLRTEARMLAKHGVNLVRIHHGYFDENGNVDRAAIGACSGHRRGHEGRGNLQPLFDLFPALAQAKARDDPG